MAGVGYRLPGTTIEEVTLPKSVNISTSQRLPVFIGTASNYIKVNYESVVRSVGGIDNLAYTSAGIYSITQTGSQRGLKDILPVTHYNLVADQIVWTSAGMAFITSGATYLVSYYYTRPYDPLALTDPTLNDFRYKEFTAFEDVLADLGDDISTNPLVNIAQLALKTFGIPKIATVQIPNNNLSSYTDAFTLIKYRNVQTVCCLTSAANVRTLLASHVSERSLPDNGRWRMGWTGAPAGTVIGDDTNPNSVRGIAYGLKNERMLMVNATRAKYYYTDPTTREQLYYTVDGAFIAAAVAAYRDTFAYPAQNLLNKTIPGLELFSEDYDDYYTEYMLTQAGSSSVFLIQNGTGNAMKVIDDLTTDNSTVERNNLNIITAKDYIAQDVVTQMNNTFRGKLIVDRSMYAGTVQAYLALMFAAYKFAGIIEEVGTLKVTLPTSRRDTVDIFYSYYSVYSHKYTTGQYALEV